MSITRLAIEKNRVTTVVLVVVCLAGAAAFLEMPRAEDPGFIIRTAQVVTYFPGASPGRVERLVTEPLETAIQEMPELDFVESQSKSGVSIVFVNIDASYSELRPIWDKLRRKVDRAARSLPDGIVGPLVNDEFGDVFGIVVTLVGEGYSDAELKEVADEVRDELLALPDAAKVEIHGSQDEYVFVEYDTAELARLGVTPYQLMGALATSNIIVPGGSVETATERLVVEPSGNFETLDDLRATVINLPGRAGVATLGDIARVTRGYQDPPSSEMRTGGERALGIAISMREGGNIITLGEQVLAVLARLEAGYPIGIEFDTVAFQPAVVDDSVRGFTSNVVQAIVIVFGVMLVFLGIRTGILVASLVPAAMLVTLLVMSWLDIGLDKVSLAALIIALGMLVDNAIVMSESIMVQMEAGKRALDAAVASARELRLSLLTSSLTTASAFLPIFLAESNVGEFTAPLFKVVTITLLGSWALAITMIPTLCVAFMKVKRRTAPAGGGPGDGAGTAGTERALAGDGPPDDDPPDDDGSGFDSAFYRAYRGFLLAMVRFPPVTLVLMFALFAAAIYAFRFVPATFFPDSTRPTLQATLTLPAGTPIEETAAVVRDVESFLRERRVTPPPGVNPAVGSDEGPQGVVNWAAFIGQGAPRFVLNYTPTLAAPETAFLIINTTSGGAVSGIAAELEAYCRERHPDLSVDVRPLSDGPPVASPVAVRFSGRDEDRLFAIVAAAKEQFAAIPGTKGIDDDWGAWAKKLRVEVDETVARRAGISNQDVAVSLQTALSGFETTQFREDDKVIPVTLRSVAEDRGDIDRLEAHVVYSQTTGIGVPLKQVAEIVPVWEPSVVKRRDRRMTVTVSADLEPGFNAIAVNAELRPWLEAQKASWPLGYDFEIGGTAESSATANQSIMDQLPVAGFLILMLLVLQFNSIRRAAIIVLTIPLALIGVVIGLLAADSYFGFMTLLGVVSLAGIVINNAIVLIDRIDIEIGEVGRPPSRAVIEAAQRRLRPILLTTITTIGGLLPLWFGGGPLWEPMAIAIIFGLLFSTVLTLGFVPALYSLLFRVRFAGFSYPTPVVPPASGPEAPPAESESAESESDEPESDEPESDGPAGAADAGDDRDDRDGPPPSA